MMLGGLLAKEDDNKAGQYVIWLRRKGRSNFD